jgi:hypothetical protein
MRDLPTAALSRRHFLATAGGAVAGAVLLGACGGDDDDTDVGAGAGSTTTTDSGRTGGDLVLAAYLQGPFYAAGLESRVIFGLADEEGLLTYEATPEELEVSVIGPDAAPTVEKVTVQRHGQGLPRAYFPLRITLDEPGIYTVRAEPEGQPAAEMAFEVKDAAQVTVVKPGDQMPAATPTSADPRGVTPICTAEPACALHDVTLAEALREDRPVALLVATPKFCKVSACGPVHDVLLSAVAGHPDVHFLHAEVYVHPEVNTTDLAPVLSDLRMFAEPALFLVGSDGVVRDRLDSIYDGAELDGALGKLS